jgi:putative chitinase
MITIEQLKTFIPVLRNATDSYQELLDALTKTFNHCEINTPRRVRYFMSQVFFETEGFLKFSENLFYTKPERLVEVWPTRFSMTRGVQGKAFAPDYINNAVKLGNLVYANRNGNGDVASGDGFNFRGGGGLHLTFRDNYTKCSKAMYGDDRLVQNPRLVEAYDAAMMSAGWFWSVNKLNALADADEFTKMTGVINGSTSTAPKRLLVLNKANIVF